MTTIICYSSLLPKIPYILQQRGSCRYYGSAGVAIIFIDVVIIIIDDEGFGSRYLNYCRALRNGMHTKVTAQQQQSL